MSGLSKLPTIIDVDSVAAGQFVGIYVRPELAVRTLHVDQPKPGMLRAAKVNNPRSVQHWQRWRAASGWIVAPQTPQDWVIQQIQDAGEIMRTLVLERAAVDTHKLDVQAIADAAPWLDDVVIYGGDPA
jgi:hypothetical protein